MYQLRYLVYVVLTLYGQGMVAQDQINPNSVGVGAAPVALQTLQSKDEVRPLVTTSQDVPVGVDQQSAVQDSVLPRVPQEDSAAQVPLSSEASQIIMPVSAVPVSTEPVSAAPAGPVGDTPSVPQPVSVEDLPEKIVEPKGIDTVDIKEPEGNWLFKRIWWEKSKEIYGKIRERVDKIVESRMHFFKERVKLDRDVLDPFYVDMGLDQGALRESVDHLLGILEKEHEAGSLSVDAEEKYAALQEEKAAITKLGESVTIVQGLDKKLDEVLDKLMNQINLARSYESEAWSRLDQIAEELNDKKAREHYYAIATLWRNVKDIGNYIQGPFAEHFIQLAQVSVQNVKNIKSIADSLRQKGFALKERIELTLKNEEKRDDEDEDDWPVKKPLGWGDWLWDKLTGWF